MIVCLCHGVGERAIEAAIGAGATTLDDIATACAAGSDCGACQDMLLDLLVDPSRAGARGGCAAFEYAASVPAR